MRELVWILGSGALMSAISLVGALVLVVREQALKRLLGPLVALAAGSLLGAALFHLVPSSLESGQAPLTTLGVLAVGFVSFLMLEQLLHWHRSHELAPQGVPTETPAPQGAPADAPSPQDAPEPHRPEPVGTLILIGDGVHNLLDGLAIGAAFVVDVRLGVVTWVTTAAHEIPQELGDFGVLVHSGFSPRRALVYNLLSGLTFLVGGIIAWALSRNVDVGLLLPFAAGSFLYIGASDLVPEIKHTTRTLLVATQLGAFLFGLGLLFALAFWLE